MTMINVPRFLPGGAKEMHKLPLVGQWSSVQNIRRLAPVGYIAGGDITKNLFMKGCR
jgi:hypothetical protein